MKRILAAWLTAAALMPASPWGAQTAMAQIDPQRITIARDSFGVPHIFAPTDSEAAYGLAWAHAQDDFPTIQLVMLAGKGELGTALGIDGAKADYVLQLLHCRQVAESQIDSLRPDFRSVMRGYIAGITAYARAHPDEVKYKHALPFDEVDYLSFLVLSLSRFCGVDQALMNIYDGRQRVLPGWETGGSNGFAFSPGKTTTGEAFLAINAHQPLEGPEAFYEAHVCSDQGWNVLGGLFPGACVILHGTNENLGWAHTDNYQHKVDVYQLKTDAAHPDQYLFDGQWLPLEVTKATLHIKGVPLTVHRDAYWCKYGPVLKAPNGYFAIRLGAAMDCRALEEWYLMDKARNFTEFYRALSMNSIPMFNILYADRYDTIFYISNGKMPVHNPNYHWAGTVPGDTSATLWTSFKPESALPQYLNPPSGYLFNCNHSPFLATDPACNLNPKNFDPNDGYETYMNNRSERVMEYMKGSGKIDYETFRRMKFDRQLPAHLRYHYGIDTMLSLRPTDYPDIAGLIRTFRSWDKKGDATSPGAAIFLLTYYHVADVMGNTPPRQLTLQESIDTYRYVKDYMTKYFGRTDLVLGDIQKLVRGDSTRPASGLPDVLAAANSEPYKDGLRKVTYGDAYICLVRYPHEGLPIIESINVFGASSRPDSPHYRDQETMFQEQRLKHETLDKQEILRTAERVYHPM